MPSNSTTLLSSSSNQAKRSKTVAGSVLSGSGKLVRLLPAGTLFSFLYLSPVLTNNGQCHVVHKYLSSILIAVCGLSCVFSSFTDSYIDSEGDIHYGIVTPKGLWPSSDTTDLSSYKLRIGDFVHAFLALVIFAVIALLSPDVVDCFYPDFKSTQKALLMSLPPVIGVISSSVSVMFPNARYGIGHPRDETSASSKSLA